jgi:hypothetical protein
MIIAHYERNTGTFTADYSAIVVNLIRKIIFSKSGYLPLRIRKIRKDKL